MQLLPNSDHFFLLFEQLAQQGSKTAKILDDLTLGKDLPKYIKKAAKIEHDADQICHELYKESDKAFVTPIDREDIQLLAKHLDNVIDLTENTISNVYLYNIKKLTPEFRKFSALVVETTLLVEELVGYLKHKSKNLAEMKDLVIEIHSLENKGDELTRKSFYGLFHNGKNAIEVMKWKDLYENLELILDECEDVSDAVETIIVKNF